MQIHSQPSPQTRRTNVIKLNYHIIQLSNHQIENMAKESVKARQRKRERMVAQYAEKREALKAAGDWKALDELPKNSSKVRLKNRCQMTGRPRGYSRYFGVSRIALRDMALNGTIPGLKKASW